MIVLPDPLRARLLANAEQSARDSFFDPAPVVRLFNPLGPATWLASELYADEDTLFGLADLGFGCPELGCFSLREIGAVRLPFGMGIECDLAFATVHRLSVWADTARAAGSILHADTVLSRLSPDPSPEQPFGDGTLHDLPPP